MTNAMEIVKAINDRLDHIEAMLKEMRGEAQEPVQEQAAAARPEWDNYEALKAVAAEVHKHLAEWREAFWVRKAQGKTRYARDAIYAIRVIVSIFERRFASATSVKPDDMREKVLCKVRDLAAALDKINYSLNALVDEGEGDTALSDCRGPNQFNIALAFSDRDGALQLGWEVYMPFAYGWLKEAVA